MAERYTYDLADKMLTAGARSYTYDAAGRTTAISSSSGTTTLAYDYESRVTAITGPGINETHTYNGLDTRVGTVQGGVSRTFVRDGSYVTDPVLRDGQATYTPGVSERRGGVSTWSHSGLKNADAQTTSVGAIAATRVYDAFGAELSATGTWKGPFGYAGGFGYQEDSSGLKLLGHRYYDPTTGRFLSRDPIKDGRNWYVYCDSDPLSNADPTGLSYGDEFEFGGHTFRREIRSISDHAATRMGERGLSPGGLVRFVRTGMPVSVRVEEGLPPAVKLAMRNGGFVVINTEGNIITVNRGGLGSMGYRGVTGAGSPPPASAGGSRSPGSGGALSALLTVAIGLSALAEGTSHTAKYRMRIQTHRSLLDEDVHEMTYDEISGIDRQWESAGE